MGSHQSLSDKLLGFMIDRRAPYCLAQDNIYLLEVDRLIDCADNPENSQVYGAATDIAHQQYVGFAKDTRRLGRHMRSSCLSFSEAYVDAVVHLRAQAGFT